MWLLNSVADVTCTRAPTKPPCARDSVRRAHRHLTFDSLSTRLELHKFLGAQSLALCGPATPLRATAGPPAKSLFGTLERNMEHGEWTSLTVLLFY